MTLALVLVTGDGVLAGAGGGRRSPGGGARRRSAGDGRGARSLGTTLEQRELVDRALPETRRMRGPMGSERKAATTGTTMDVPIEEKGEGSEKAKRDREEIEGREDEQRRGDGAWRPRRRPPRRLDRGAWALRREVV